MLALAAAPGATAQAPVIAEQDASTHAARAGDQGGQPKPSDDGPRITLSLLGANGGDVMVGERLRLVGKVFPYVPRQRVRILFKKGRAVVSKTTLRVKRRRGRNFGTFRTSSRRLLEPGKYRFGVRKPATEEQDAIVTRTRAVGIDYPDLDPGARGSKVRLFNKLLKRQAYYTPRGESYGSATERAVLAFHKVNNMPRTGNATAGDFRALAAGRGGYRLKWGEGGKHVEVDLSRQVMVLARGDKPLHIFHVSTGSPATPTIRGKTTFFRKQPGTNSRGMVHSVYFGPTDRGYATHGYPSVPTYPASHGCVRNPIPNSRFIYKWIDLGDGMYVYG